jgi:hypothetical protein
LEARDRATAGRVVYSAAHPLGVAAETGGKAWLLTFGPQGGSSTGGTRVTELGPLTIPAGAAEYKLRLQQRISQPGYEGDADTHPGAEAWYMLAGEQNVVSSGGTVRLVAGQGLVGPAPGSPMQLTFAGADLSDVLTFLVLDGAQPASTPATIVPGQGPRAGGYASGAAASGAGWVLLLIALPTLGVLALARRRAARRA